MKKFFLLLSLALFLYSGSSYASSIKELRIMNNNVYVYQGDQKIDQLTTRGNTSQECDFVAHNPCIGYQIIKASGNFAVVSRWIEYDGIVENTGPSVFVYDFQKKDASLVDISSSLYKKYGFDNSLYFHLAELSNGNFTLDAFITDEMGISIKKAKQYGFKIGKLDAGKGTNATLSIPATFFTDLIKDLGNNLATVFDPKKYIDAGYTQDRLISLDIDGDGKMEKLISMISSKADRWKMRILREENGKWKIIKEDQEKWKNTYRNDGERNPFLLEVHDFGSDGKMEVVVSKTPGINLDTFYNNKTYSVFGMIDGVFGDYPIPRGYLHPEWFSDYGGSRLLRLKIQGDSIIEGYLAEIPSSSNGSMGDIQFDTVKITQNYKNGGFVGNSQKKIFSGVTSDMR